MSEINIAELPNEILEEIFSFSNGELKKLSLVCKRFNEAIGSSKKLMSKLTMRFGGYSNNKRELQSLLASDRRYRKMYVGNISKFDFNLRQLMVRHASTLDEITLSDCCINLSEFAAVIKVLANNLRTICLDKVEFKAIKKVKPIKFHKLEQLEHISRFGYEYEDELGFLIRESGIGKFREIPVSRFPDFPKYYFREIGKFYSF